jgi:hypothetical protein
VVRLRLKRDPVVLLRLGRILQLVQIHVPDAVVQRRVPGIELQRRFILAQSLPRILGRRLHRGVEPDVKVDGFRVLRRKLAGAGDVPPRIGRTMLVRRHDGRREVEVRPLGIDPHPRFGKAPRGLPLPLHEMKPDRRDVRVDRPGIEPQQFLHVTFRLRELPQVAVPRHQVKVGVEILGIEAQEAPRLGHQPFVVARHAQHRKHPVRRHSPRKAARSAGIWIVRTAQPCEWSAKSGSTEASFCWIPGFTKAGLIAFNAIDVQLESHLNRSRPHDPLRLPNDVHPSCFRMGKRVRRVQGGQQ